MPNSEPFVFDDLDNEEVVVATSMFCSASLEVIKASMRSRRDDGLLIPCKVAAKAAYGA
jgi:hypothetical protein